MKKKHILKYVLIILWNFNSFYIIISLGFNHFVLDLTPSLIEQRKNLFDGIYTETFASNAPSEVPEMSMSIDPVSLDQIPSPAESDFYRKPYDFGPVLDSPLPTPSKLSFSRPRKQSNLQNDSMITRMPRNYQAGNETNIVGNVNYSNMGSRNNSER